MDSKATMVFYNCPITIPRSRREPLLTWRPKRIAVGLKRLTALFLFWAEALAESRR
jgi:hypothetical protein